MRPSQSAESSIKATHHRTLKHTRQGNPLMVLHLGVPKYHCLDCNRYFRQRFEGIRPRFRATETFRLEVLEAHNGGVSQRQFTRKKGYATTLVDLKNRKVFDVVLGRSQASLRSYLRRLPGKENVRVIVMAR